MLGSTPCHTEVGEEERFGVLLFYTLVSLTSLGVCYSVPVCMVLAEGVLCRVGNKIKSVPSSPVGLSNIPFSFSAAGGIKLKSDVEYMVGTFTTMKKDLTP